MRKVIMPPSVLKVHEKAFAAYVEKALQRLLKTYHKNHEYCEYLTELMVDPKDPSKKESIVIRPVTGLVNVVECINMVKSKYPEEDWKPLEESLKKVFSYDYRFVRGNNSEKWDSGRYIECMITMGLVYCPYCNFNTIEAYQTCQGTKHKGPLDHFYDKGTYPYLALSIYNLIPVCDQCNREKLTGPTSLTKHSHPFHDDFHKLVCFEVSGKPLDILYGDQETCKIKLCSLNKRRSPAAMNLATDVELVNRYNTIGGWRIARDIYNKCVRYRKKTIVDYCNLAKVKEMSLVELCIDEFGVKPDGSDINCHQYGKLRNDLMPASLKRLEQ